MTPATEKSSVAPATAATGLFVGDGQTYDPFRPATGEPLPAKTYALRSAPMRGFYLDRVDDLGVPSRIYGVQHDSRILAAYHDRAAAGVSTGVWLNGDKGSGKTLLAAVLSARMRDAGLPTILVQEPYTGPAFNTLVAHVGRACWIFDEFEKTYRDDEQRDSMLTVLAGSVVAQNLYVLTTNSTCGVNGAMFNRPTRVRYFIEYSGVHEDVVKEYVEHRLVDASRRSEMVKLLATVPDCNFDILQCVVEEHNRFGGSPTELLGLMNVTRRVETTWAIKFDGVFTRSDEKPHPCTGVASWGGDLYRSIVDGVIDTTHVDDIELRVALTAVARPRSARVPARGRQVRTDAPVAAEEPSGVPSSWHIRVPNGSMATFDDAAGTVTVTLEAGQTELRGLLTFKRKHGFSTFRQRF